MGVWQQVAKFASKQTERVMLVLSGMQWGDYSNDEHKISKAITTYENNRSAHENNLEKADSQALMYSVISMIIVVVILIVAMCFKIMLETVKQNKTTQERVPLSTLRSRTSGGTV